MTCHLYCLLTSILVKYACRVKSIEDGANIDVSYTVVRSVMGFQDCVEEKKE